MKKKSFLFVSTLSMALALTSTAQAQVSKKEANKLRTTLTPLGGERAGNADGSIPPWRGGIQFPPSSYKRPGQHHKKISYQVFDLVFPLRKNS